MGCKLGIDPRQVENRSDLANQVIVGNGLFKTKRVKQPTLVVIEPPHHRPTPPRIVSERRNHCSREPSTTFATKSAQSGHARRLGRCPLLGVKRTSPPHDAASAFDLPDGRSFEGRNRMDDLLACQSVSAYPERRSASAKQCVT